MQGRCAGRADGGYAAGWKAALIRVGGRSRRCLHRQPVVDVGVEEGAELLDDGHLLLLQVRHHLGGELVGGLLELGPAFGVDALGEDGRGDLRGPAAPSARCCRVPG